MEFKAKKFKKILRMTQDELHDSVMGFLNGCYDYVFESDKFIYAEGSIPVLLVAHLDTVHKNLPTNIVHDPWEKFMWSPQGIGGDDRCGVYAIKEILNDGYRPHILFTHDEEIGAIGASQAVRLMNCPKINYMIELDRRGVNDAVFYSCENKEFQEYVTNFGFTKQTGSFSDICKLSDAWDVASVNLSIGYLNEHSTSEYISINAMMNTAKKVENMLDDAAENPKAFAYEKYVFKYNYNYIPKHSYYNAEEIDEDDEYDTDEYYYNGYYYSGNKYKPSGVLEEIEEAQTANEKSSVEDNILGRTLTFDDINTDMMDLGFYGMCDIDFKPEEGCIVFTSSVTEQTVQIDFEVIGRNEDGEDFLWITEIN